MAVASSSSSPTAVLRLMADLKGIRTEVREGCSARTVSDEDLFVWSATVFGPYEIPLGRWGVRAEADVRGQLPGPGEAARVRFTCEVFHPNVSKGGGLCMDIINNAWSPCHNVCSILTSIQSILTDPNPSSPANLEAAHLFQNDIQAYNKRVRWCARRSIESA